MVYGIEDSERNYFGSRRRERYSFGMHFRSIDDAAAAAAASVASL